MPTSRRHSSPCTIDPPPRSIGNADDSSALLTVHHRPSTAKHQECRRLVGTPPCAPSTLHREASGMPTSRRRSSLCTIDLPPRSIGNADESSALLTVHHRPSTEKHRECRRVVGTPPCAPSTLHREASGMPTTRRRSSLCTIAPPPRSIGNADESSALLAVHHRPSTAKHWECRRVVGAPHCAPSTLHREASGMPTSRRHTSLCTIDLPPRSIGNADESSALLTVRCLQTNQESLISNPSWWFLHRSRANPASHLISSISFTKNRRIKKQSASGSLRFDHPRKYGHHGGDVLASVSAERLRIQGCRYRGKAGVQQRLASRPQRSRHPPTHTSSAASQC